MAKPSKSQVTKMTKAWSAWQYGSKNMDSAKEVNRAFHQARNDAVGTEYEGRSFKKGETKSSSVKKK